MELSEDDVLHILKLIDESKFDYFQLEVGELKITVSKGDPIPIAGAAQPAPASVAPSPAPAAAKPAPAASAAPAAQAAKPVTVPEGMLPITEDTTVGLIEVMKVFNSVRSTVKGTIVEVVAQNGHFVEFGQTLFIVKP